MLKRMAILNTQQYASQIRKGVTEAFNGRLLADSRQFELLTQ